MPLTSITAWEALYDRLCICADTTMIPSPSRQGVSNPNPNPNSNSNNNSQIQPSILIIGGAGGVGSIAIQLAKNIVGCPITSSTSEIKVVATASRNESIEWCRKMGADNVINHRADLKFQIKESLSSEYVDYILCLNNTDGHFESMKQLIAPQGRICSIVETAAPVNIGGVLRQKSATFVWELMFTRSFFQTYDMVAQHIYLTQ